DCRRVNRPGGFDRARIANRTPIANACPYLQEGGNCAGGDGPCRGGRYDVTNSRIGRSLLMREFVISCRGQKGSLSGSALADRLAGPASRSAAAACSRPTVATWAAPFVGQIPPSQLRLRHLKSGARGLRLESRLSHMRPPHFGQLISSNARTADESASAASTCKSAFDEPLSPFERRDCARARRLSLRAYASAGSSSGFAFRPSPSTCTQFCSYP